MQSLPALTERQKRNFWSQVHISEAVNCWDWMGLVHTSGYGRIGFQDKDYIAHRIAYFLHTGTDPLSSNVIQICENRKCCNPDHLQLKVRCAILSRVQVQSIREQIANGISIQVLAQQHNVGRTTIRDIINRKTWKDIEEAN